MKEISNLDEQVTILDAAVEYRNLSPKEQQARSGAYSLAGKLYRMGMDSLIQAYSGTKVFEELLRAKKQGESLTDHDLISRVETDPEKREELYSQILKNLNAHIVDTMRFPLLPRSNNPIFAPQHDWTTEAENARKIYTYLDKFSQDRFRNRPNLKIEEADLEHAIIFFTGDRDRTLLDYLIRHENVFMKSKESEDAILVELIELSEDIQKRITVAGSVTEGKDTNSELTAETNELKNLMTKVQEALQKTGYLDHTVQ